MAYSIAGIATAAALLAALAGCGGGGETSPIAAKGSDGGAPDAADDGGPQDAAIDEAAAPKCTGAGAWTSAGSSNVGRYAPAITALDDGRVLVAGGWSTSGGAQASTFAYDPDANTHAPLSSLTKARNFPAIARIPGGFLLAGGFNDALGSVRNAERFDPTAGTFTAVGELALARELHSATALPDGRVIVIGGLSAVGLLVRANAELFDPATSKFSPSGDLVKPRFGQDAIWIDSVKKVFVVGGKTTGPGGDVFIPEAEWFDPTTQAFSLAGSLATARDRPTASLLPDGRVLVAGGSNATDMTLDSTEIFDPKTATFSPGPTMGTRRMAHSAVTLADGHVVVVGGWSDSSSPSGSTASAEVLDPLSLTWSPLPSLAAARHDLGAVRVGACGVFVAGGIQVEGSVTKTPTPLERIDLTE